MNAHEVYPVLIPCQNEELLGIVHRGSPTNTRGVVIVVAGGPQYRVGAHRQFVSLARRLAAVGHTVLRFDLRGMGDSSGRHLGYEHSRSDIEAAVDSLLKHESQLTEIVLFGECESASGILFYAFHDVRIKGIALVNPWVRTEEVRAQVYVKHYYFQRLGSAAFWAKVRKGEFHLFESLASFLSMLKSSVLGALKELRGFSIENVQGDLAQLPLPARTAVGFQRFRGQILLMLSGKDLIAREFDQVISSSSAWKALLDDPKVVRRDLADANHTFSNPVTKKQAQDTVLEWIAGW